MGRADPLRTKAGSVRKYSTDSNTERLTASAWRPACDASDAASEIFNRLEYETAVSIGGARAGSVRFRPLRLDAWALRSARVRPKNRLCPSAAREPGATAPDRFGLAPEAFGAWGASGQYSTDSNTKRVCSPASVIGGRAPAGASNGRELSGPTVRRGAAAERPASAARGQWRTASSGGGCRGARGSCRSRPGKVRWGRSRGSGR